MAYAVRIARVAFDGTRAVYVWESSNGPAGHIVLDVPTATFRPADASGRAIGAMAFRRGDADVTAPDSETLKDFLTAVAGIIRRWRGPEPPESGHLYFG